jgi:rod shape-determining protein MreC
MQQFTKTRLYKIVLITAFFGLLVFLNPYYIFNPIRSVLLLVSYPFSKITYSFSLKVSNIKSFVSSIGNLSLENEKLIRENQILTFENAKFQNIENENVQLREQLGMLPRDKFNLKSVSVISVDTKGLGSWIEIDKGSKDGMAIGMPVIVSKGVLIGKIQEIGISTSKVQLITNPKSTVNVMTSKNSSMGVIKGEYGLGMILDMVLQSDSLNIGDSVVTSGIGGSFPKGLYVGTIQEIHPSDDHLFQQAVVISPVAISKLQFVFVIKDAL